MCDNHLYEYAVIRYVPRVEREEFINVGLVMMCKRLRWIKARIHLDPGRITSFYPAVELEAVANQLKSFECICSGHSESPIAQLDTHERFRWLTAVRSASVATSRPHPGHTANLDNEFDRLFTELVI